LPASAGRGIEHPTYLWSLSVVRYPYQKKSKYSKAEKKYILGMGSVLSDIKKISYPYSGA